MVVLQDPGHLFPSNFNRIPIFPQGIQLLEEAPHHGGAHVFPSVLLAQEVPPRLDLSDHVHSQSLRADIHIQQRIAGPVVEVVIKNNRLGIKQGIGLAQANAGDDL